MAVRPLLLAAALALAAPATAAAAPSAATCARVAATRSVAPIVAADARPGAPRVFAMQFKQEGRHVVSYASFRTKLECLIRTDVVPHLAKGRPNVVAFDEDIGLMVAGIGSRGRAAQRILADPSSAPGCAGQAFPCQTLQVLAALNTGYARQRAYYTKRLGALSPLSGPFTVATDTIVRGFMGTFSDLARRYGVYLLGSGPLPTFTASSKPADVAALADPDLSPRPTSVYVATDRKIYNEAFLWAPKDHRKSGPPMLRNLVARNRKVPLTSIENALGFSPGPPTGAAAVANVRPYALPGTKARLAFATSLPAFVYGDPPAGTDPCRDTSKYYMRCLDKLGANVVIQDEANPGQWTGADGDGIEQWQPLSWMTSTWRAVSDPTVHFAYDVTPMLVGNLADLAFDGQSAITQRGLTGSAGCHYVGNAAWIDGEDRPDLTDEAGPKTAFLALAPWVTPDAPRAALRATGDQLAPNSGDPLENDYVETALVADLPIPADPARRTCLTR